jgi:hypothetical protein
MQALLSYQMLIGGSPKSGTFLFMVSIFLDHCSTNFFGSFFRSFQSRWSCDKFGSYFNFVCSKKVFTKKNRYLTISGNPLIDEISISELILAEKLEEKSA